MVPRVCLMRTRAAGHSSVTVSTDMTNAFGCSERDNLDAKAEGRLRPQDLRLSQCRRARLFLEIDTSEGHDNERPQGIIGQGCCMGDKGAPQDFCEDFQKAVSEWNMRKGVADARTRTRGTCTDTLHDGSIAVYADDIIKTASSMKRKTRLYAKQPSTRSKV